MSWRLRGALRNARDDYRDNRVISEIVQEVRQGVVIIGVSRVGKTTLLYRLENHPEMAGCVLVDVHPKAKLTLERMEDSAQGFLFDEAQYFLDWEEKDLIKLRRKLGMRRFVMAGWPKLLKSQRPPELERLMDSAVLRVLPPFRLADTERLVRREQSEERWECDAVVARAIHEATGGFPYLTDLLCERLRDSERRSLRLPGEDDLQGFLDSCIEEDPFQGIYDSLPPRMREVLEEHRAGRKAPLDALGKTGLVVTSGGETNFGGSLFTLAWGPRSEWRPEHSPPPELAQAAGRSEVSQPVFKWLHVSDLHFGGGNASHGMDRETVLKLMLEDVRSHRPWSPDRIFVTGDIAWKAAAQEYREASSWLNQLAAVAGVEVSVLRLVPGNHDVDRGRAKARAVRVHHKTIRRAARARKREDRPVAQMDESLRDSTVRSELRKKLEAYLAFMKELVSPHPDNDPRNHPHNGQGELLDWREVLEPMAGTLGRLWLVGLSSVWVSDEDDGERKLFLGEDQLRALQDVGPQDLLMLLTHHPPGWLHGDCEALLRRRLAERTHHIHLCGHVHHAEALALRGFGRSRESVRLVAGAGHGDADGEHAYAWGALRWNEAKASWELGWAPRVFVPGEGWKRDRNRYDVGDDGFAWQPLPLLKWAPPALRSMG